MFMTHNQVVAGSSPVGPTENQALTLIDVSAFLLVKGYLIS